VSGKIIKVHTRNTDYKGYTHHATPDDPQYEIKSGTTDHVAINKGTALKKYDISFLAPRLSVSWRAFECT
jgi:hypothetical protein